MNEKHEAEFIRVLRKSGIKVKDFNRLIHSFAVIEIAAFENNTSAGQIIAIYNLAEISLARG